MIRIIQLSLPQYIGIIEKIFFAKTCL